jgi:hypothetical protein
MLLLITHRESIAPQLPSSYRGSSVAAQILKLSSRDKVFLKGLRRMRYLASFLLAALLVVSSAACSIHVQRENRDFDKLYGKGPVLIVPTDETALSTAFFRKNWTASPTIKHLVMQRGTPDAISVEREFLQPHRLKLFYPSAGQVYLLDQVGGEWLVAGSEPLERNDLELVTAQRNRAASPVPAVLPVRHVPSPTPQQPVAAAAPIEFRGMLRPPVSAGVARLTKASHDTFVHTVTFPREDLVILADWYTNDTGNAALLSRNNHRNPQGPLALGEQISIPTSLMRNLDPLPEAMVP